MSADSAKPIKIIMQETKIKEKPIPGFFYFYVHSRLWNMVKGEQVSRKDFTSLLYEWRIPKQFREAIIKELELLGLIKIESKFLIRIFPPRYNDESLHLLLHSIILTKEVN